MKLVGEDVNLGESSFFTLFFILLRRFCLLLLNFDDIIFKLTLQQLFIFSLVACNCI